MNYIIIEKKMKKTGRMFEKGMVFDQNNVSQKQANPKGRKARQSFTSKKLFVE